ncbi:MAG: cbb3-type cytochrome oxidase assembly protein CcoS [Gammaproteobacteria bacterium]|nr:cbb3-type cytochrome oxidase assembly protein CcoS [Gammaproteobacteria bacterium]
MEIIYLLIPLSIVLLGLIVWVFMWAIGSGQFDDLEGPAHRILMDEELPLNTTENKKNAGGADPGEK